MWNEGTQLYNTQHKRGSVGNLFLMVSTTTEILFTVIFFPSCAVRLFPIYICKKPLHRGSVTGECSGHSERMLRLRYSCEEAGWWLWDGLR